MTRKTLIGADDDGTCTILENRRLFWETVRWAAPHTNPAGLSTEVVQRRRFEQRQRHAPQGCSPLSGELDCPSRLVETPAALGSVCTAHRRRRDRLRLYARRARGWRTTARPHPDEPSGSCSSHAVER